MAPATLKQRIFISYSREPAANSAFAHELAQVLRANGFEPWLDEEQIPGGAHFESYIREAIGTAQHGLFIITKRWLERDYTRFELSLFSQHPTSHQRVAVMREEFGTHELAPEMHKLNIIDWRPDDPQPDARMWLVYCGLTSTPPGPKDGWTKKGRELFSKLPPEPVEPEEKRHGEEVPDWVPCRAKPILALGTAQETYLLSDIGECFRTKADGRGRLERLPDLDGWSAAVVDADGTIVAGLFAPMAAVLREGSWEFKPLDAPALAVAATGQGWVVGDSAGTVVLFQKSGNRLKDVVIGEPVAELCAYLSGAVVLGVRGVLGKLPWTEEGPGVFERIETAADFVPVGLFAVEPDRRSDPVGVYSSDRIGIYDDATGKLAIGVPVFPEGIRAVASLGAGSGPGPSPICVLTDVGGLFLVDPKLKKSQPIPLPGDAPEAVGICGGGAGGLLAWTSAGALFLIHRDRAVRPLADSDVVLACQDPEHANQHLAIRWRPDRGLQVQTIRSDPSR